MSEKPIIVWMGRDLRLDDQPALDAAAKSGRPVVPVFVWPEFEVSGGDGGAPDESAAGGAGRWWLCHSLTALQKDLSAKGSPLVLRDGPPSKALPELAGEIGAEAVYLCRFYEPALIAETERLAAAMAEQNVEIKIFRANQLYEDHDRIETGSGGPYKVFTPFYKNRRRDDPPPSPKDAPSTLTPPVDRPESVDPEGWELYPRRLNWWEGFVPLWKPGEAGARHRFDLFVPDRIAEYDRQRDLPAVDGVSRLSPHLRFGEISVRRIWSEVGRACERKGAGEKFRENAESFRRQLIWREFSRYILHHFPETASEPMRPEFADFPWRDDSEGLEAWRRGRTGFPIVDAAMRELWETGYMHNRPRMIVASFLTKDLLIHWREGAAWFMNTLLDGDLANNIFGWQWTAGSGADAAPYFRIFNPETQGRKFDPQGEYIRRHVPELAALPTKHLHNPAEAPEGVLKDAGVILGETYPHPIVHHKKARLRALAAYEEIKKG